MALGIGLGGFAQGLGGGMNMGDRIQDRMKQRRQSAAMDSAWQGARADFEQNPVGNWEQNWPRYFAPRAAAKMFKEQNYEKGAAFLQWSRDENVQHGSNLFASGTRRMLAGDVEGGLREILESTTIPGYSPYQELTAEQTETGYRIRAVDMDGEQYEIEVRPDEVLDFIASWTNPEAMFERSQAAKAAAADSQRRVREAGDKTRARGIADIEVDNIRRNLGGGGGDTRDLTPSERRQYRKDAITELRREDMDFDDLPGSQREEKIEEKVQQMRGLPTAPAEEMVIDRQSGEPVAPSPQPGGAAQAAPVAPGPADPRPETAPLDPAPQPRPQQQQGAPAAAPQPQAPLAERIADRGIEAAQRVAPALRDTAERWSDAGERMQTQAPQVRQEPTEQARVQQALQRAQMLLARGEDPRVIAEALRRLGVPENMWPPELLAAAR